MQQPYQASSAFRCTKFQEIEEPYLWTAVVLTFHPGNSAKSKVNGKFDTTYRPSCNFFNFKHLKHADLQRLNFCSQCWNYERCLLGIIPVWKASIFFTWRRALQGCLQISHFLLPNLQKSARQCADNSQKLSILSPSPLCDYYRMIVRYWFACCCATCCIKSLLAACAFSQLLRNCNAWIRAQMRS